MKILTELSRLFRQLFSQGPRLTLLAGYDKLMRYLSRKPFWRFSRITPQIILGGQPARRVLPMLKEAGVTGVINMRSEYDYLSQIEPGTLRYLYLPTQDNSAPSLDYLRSGAEFIAEEVKKGGSVYIHCWEGLGRGPTMAAAYFVSTGMKPEEAWTKIREVRPFIRPTPSQIEQLEKFADIRQVVPQTKVVPDVSALPPNKSTIVSTTTQPEPAPVSTSTSPEQPA